MKAHRQMAHRWRLTLWFALLTSMTLVLLGGVTLTALTAHFRLDDRQSLLRHASQLDALVRDTPAVALPQRLSDVFASHNDLSIGVENAAGQAIFLQQLDAMPATAAGNWPSWQSSNRSWQGYVQSLDQPAHWRVAVGVDLNGHDTFVRRFTQAMIAATLGAALLCAAGGWWVAKRGLQPLMALRDKATEVSPRNLHERMPEDVPRELEALSQSLNQMLARLEDAFTRLTQFSADLAHDIRTPLATLTMQTQVTLSQPRNADEYREVLASNVEELERLSRTVSDMLYLAKAERADTLAREWLDLHAEAASLLDFYDVLAQEQGVQVVLQGGANVPGDRLMLRRAMSNLLSNAMAHTPQGGRIQVDLGEDDRQAWFAVFNSGTPIAESDLHLLFDRFYRGRRSKQEGSGLGLAITRAIVLAHGGQIAAHARADGNCFIVHLPLQS